MKLKIFSYGQTRVIIDGMVVAVGVMFNFGVTIEYKGELHLYVGLTGTEPYFAKVKVVDGNGLGTGHYQLTGIGPASDGIIRLPLQHHMIAE
jgi:hypothetical protein